MNQQQKIGGCLGFGVLFGPAAARAHANSGDESTLAQLFHQLLHAAQEPAAITIFSIGAVLTLLFYHHQRGD